MPEPGKRVSLILTLVGGALLAGAVIRYVSAPAERAFASPGWFESAEAHHSATFQAAALAMFGVFVLLMGIGLNPAVRKRAREIRGADVRYLAKDAAEGLRAGAEQPSVRLERLQQLHASGAITDDEYARKRAEIVELL
jgi:hypothetical protein